MQYQARVRVEFSQAGIERAIGRTGLFTSILAVLHTQTFEFVEGPSVKDLFLEFGSHGVVEERLDDIALQVGDANWKIT